MLLWVGKMNPVSVDTDVVEDQHTDGPKSEMFPLAPENADPLRLPRAPVASNESLLGGAGEARGRRSNDDVVPRFVLLLLVVVDRLLVLIDVEKLVLVE